MSKLWGGRFSDRLDSRFARFNASLSFDRRLLEFDLLCASAHAEALRRGRCLSEEEADAIQQALTSIGEECRRDPELLDRAVEEGVEDVHSFVESRLLSRIGEVGLKLNTGRSRNDQVATDLRLFVRQAIERVDTALHMLQESLLELARRHPETPLPGYSHLQKAQPVLLAHYLLAYFEMFDRDRERLSGARGRLNRCPAGAAALAGSSYPLDRRLEARLMGFDGPCSNSIDAVSDRDFVLEFTAAACLVMMHLSRLSEDWVVYSSSEFGFLELSDAVATGSSLMPQKRNPDALELIRGKTGRVYGAHMALMTLLKGLPLSYNKDLQEDKAPLFDAVDTTLDCLDVMRVVLQNTSFQSEKLRTAVGNDYLNATELADYLTQKGMPFRRAHELTGQVVRQAAARGRRLDELSLRELRRHSRLFEEDLFGCLSWEQALAAKDVEGGTAPRRVAEALAAAEVRLQQRQKSAT